MPDSTPSKLVAWAQLVRLPNVFTILADVSAAFLLTAQGPEPAQRWICVLLGAVCLYWAGMVLNDVFDVERDREERPKRPIPAGHIPHKQAAKAGWGLLVLGVILAGLSGFLPNERLPSTWVPLAVAVVLAVMIVAYDGPLKKTLLAPVAMGANRMLSFLLGAAPALVLVDDGPLFPRYIVAIALGFGVYIMGITTMARQEATGGPSPQLPTGLVVVILGAVMLAFAPQLSRNQLGFHVSTEAFPMMIGLIVLPVVLRGIRAATDPQPAKIQTAIRMGILTVIPLAASFAFLGAGALWGLVLFLLVVPSISLAAVFRVT